MKATNLEPSEAGRLGSAYQFEAKLDGFRCLYDGRSMLSERAIAQDHKFPHISRVLNGRGVVLDGECCLMGGTIHDINKSENWPRAVYVVFDMLSRGGEDLTAKPLSERQEILKAWIAELGSPFVVFVPKFATFEEGWAWVEATSAEGLIAKHKSSAYAQTPELLKEVRSKLWWKVKHKKEAEFVMSRWENHQDGGDGLTFTDGFHRFSVRGENATLARQLLALHGKVKVEVQYLYKTADGHLFQPVIKRVVEC